MPGNWRRFKGFFSLNGTNGTNGTNSRHAWLHEEERARTFLPILFFLRPLS
jgi:hypothetical protein